MDLREVVAHVSLSFFPLCDHMYDGPPLEPWDVRLDTPHYLFNHLYRIPVKVLYLVTS